MIDHGTHPLEKSSVREGKASVAHNFFHQLVGENLNISVTYVGIKIDPRLPPKLVFLTFETMALILLISLFEVVYATTFLNFCRPLVKLKEKSSGREGKT